VKRSNNVKLLVNCLTTKILGYVLVSEKTLNKFKSELISTQSTLQETQSTLQETQSTLQETQSTLQETQSTLQETQSTLQETQSTLQETQSTLQETQSTLQETQSTLQETGFNLLYVNNRSELLRLVCLEDVREEFVVFCAQNLVSSNSQLLQDLIAAYLQQGVGFFCEIGAADGIKLSNTFLLEKSRAWKGIVAEPAHIFRKELVANRDCQISFKCIFSESGVSLTFNETLDPLLSTIEVFSQNDLHGLSREHGTKYVVESMTLRDLLRESSAPSHVDYLSIDTEGSEFEILRDFDFGEYTFGFISVEHNYTESREEVRKLLTSNGYTRILTAVSMWDDFYVANSKLSQVLRSY
jgi:FkbM family methyltransferase